MARIRIVQNPRRVNLYLPAALIDAAKAQGFAERKSISVVVSDAVHAHIPNSILKKFGAHTAPTAAAKKTRAKKAA